MSELTAEQVREAIFDCSVYASYDGAQYYANGINMQAIADELNTRAERTCKNVDDHKTVWFICSVCGYTQKLSHTKIYCPNCGSKMVKSE